MKIGIIGIGNMGSAIAKGLLGKNELFLSNRGSNLEFFKDKEVSIMENRKNFWLFYLYYFFHLA